MRAKKDRYIQDGKDYDEFFPKANLTEKTIKRKATLSDTVRFIPKVVEETQWQTEKISKELKGKSVYETCRNIWEFIYGHVRYHKDEAGTEQIRSPARLWHDRFRGVDCDCYTVTICTMLLNCGINQNKIVLRITKYKQDHFQHIYPIVLVGNGKYITLDCVVDQFDYEEPYSEKQDTKMDLQYLDGLEQENEVGKLFKRKKKTSSGSEPKKKVGFLKKALHFTNRINPATVALRNGMLAGMKLNIFKVAQRIKWAYLSEAEAKKRGIDMAKWQKLVSVKNKLEKTFYGAGGKPENLKKAILSGKGNTNKEVQGLLGYMPEGTVFEMTERTPLMQLIGDEVYRSENIEDMEGFQGLGEPLTAGTVTAASGILAAFAGLLKNIGSIFPKKEKGSEDFENTASEDAQAEKEAKNLPAFIDDSSNSSSRLPGDNKSDKEAEEDEQKGFWNKNKKWLKPTLWGSAGLGALYAGYRFITRKKKQQLPQPRPALSGIKGKKKKPVEKKKVLRLSA